MFSRTTLAGAVASISTLMTQNRDYLVQLDQVNGDGDLGISMDDGFRALSASLEASTEDDLGQLLRASAKVFNQSAPSSLGTIISFALMGMAKALRGKTEAEFAEIAQALLEGVHNIMVKAESKPGEKTILDALVPGAEALLAHVGLAPAEAAKLAADAAAEGSEATKQMVAVHGRAAYSAARSVGILDGGSVVGRLIFEGIADYLNA
ncbi:MAG: dihydroxyacetone kinase subunit L [Propioniciclava sp.]|uniref:dihydroxyacetone kinase subunit L n=1 Tax=Propioniciclava sp. TaxID=2038686 RepID=UPI0039E4FAD9